MSEEFYTKEVVDKYLAGIFEVLGYTVGLVIEGRIHDGLTDRVEGAKLFDDLASVTMNATAKGFYEAMSDRTRNPVGAPPMPKLTVVEGGRED